VPNVPQCGAVLKTGVPLTIGIPEEEYLKITLKNGIF
jgi:hypothetical protein